MESSRLWIFLIFFFFYKLAVLRSAGQEFCKMSLNLSLSDVFLIIRLWLLVLGRMTKEMKCHFHIIKVVFCSSWEGIILYNYDIVYMDYILFIENILFINLLSASNKAECQIHKNNYLTILLTALYLESWRVCVT